MTLHATAAISSESQRKSITGLPPAVPVKHDDSSLSIMEHEMNSAIPVLPTRAEPSDSEALAHLQDKKHDIDDLINDLESKSKIYEVRSPFTYFFMLSFHRNSNSSLSSILPR
jgi:hypothetical protein